MNEWERKSNSERSLRGPNILSPNIWLDIATLPLFFTHTQSTRWEGSTFLESFPYGISSHVTLLYLKRVKSTIPLKGFALCSFTEAHTPGSPSLSLSLFLSVFLSLSTHVFFPWLVLSTHTGLIIPPEQQWTNKDKWIHTRCLTDLTRDIRVGVFGCGRGLCCQDRIKTHVHYFFL